MLPGKRQVLSVIMAAAGLLVAPLAGRVGEDGSGAMWIAPELLRTVPAQTCARGMDEQRSALVFEYLEPENAEREALRQMAATSRNGLPLDWNPVTRELELAGSHHTGMFGDVERAAAERSFLLARSCGSP